MMMTTELDNQIEDQDNELDGAGFLRRSETFVLVQQFNVDFDLRNGYLIAEGALP